MVSKWQDIPQRRTERKTETRIHHRERRDRKEGMTKSWRTKISGEIRGSACVGGYTPEQEFRDRIRPGRL
jgi:hypothetical protein